MDALAIAVPQKEIEAFCRKWKLKEFALFGSVLGDEFRADSDVDVLVEFKDEADWSLYDWIAMIDELSEIFGRKVDLVAKEGLRNPIRREAILSERQVLYEA
jgi:uncharacterized protein